MLIINPFVKLVEDYSTGSPTSFEPEQDPFLPSPDADCTTEVLTKARYRTAYDRDETLDTVRKRQHIFSSRILPMSERQVCKGRAMLTQKCHCYVKLALSEWADCVLLSVSYARTAGVHGSLKFRTPHSCGGGHGTVVDADGPRCRPRSLRFSSPSSP